MKRNFLDIYESFFDDVYRYVYFKVGNGWDVDDIVSDIFKKAYENYGSINSNVKAWIFAIARNTVVDFYKKKKDIAFGDDLDAFTYPDVFENKFDKEAELNCLKKSLYSLPKEEIEIVGLKYFSNLSNKELSLLLDKTEDAVKMKSYRIIQKLKKLVNICLEG
ncbi:MAG: RNA polymerase sigma factor [Thermoanaerobacterium sp.]|nr:RNA polymerase sigma factor [Thermoanaerobacterium sp.]